MTTTDFDTISQRHGLDEHLEIAVLGGAFNYTDVEENVRDLMDRLLVILAECVKARTPEQEAAWITTHTAQKYEITSTR